MNPDETKSLITKVLLVLFSSLSTALHLSPDASTMATGASDVADLIVLVYGVYSHWNMIKVPETAKVVGAILVALALGLASPPVSAANLAPPVVNPFTKAPVAVGCTAVSCTGGFVGGSFANAGGSFDIVGTGLTGLASNGLGVGGQAGYEYFANNLYAAIYVDASYDLSLNAPGSAITDKASWGGGVRLGYSLANIIGAVTTTGATPTLSQNLLQALMTPYINIKEEHRHNQPALGTGVGVEALLAADPTGHSSWTANVDYLRYSYNQGGAASALATMKDENLIQLSLNKHFGW